jgi:hypothetical protein
MIDIVIKVPKEMVISLEQGSFGAKYNIYDLVGCVMNGTPLSEHLNKIKDEIDEKISHYEHFSSSNTANGLMMAKEIINKYIEGSES